MFVAVQEDRPHVAIDSG